MDISDPSAPVSLPKVNVPGVLVGFDVDAKRAITSQLVRTPVSDLTAEECHTRFGMADWTAQGTCIGYLQRVQLVRLTEAGAVIEDTYALPESQQVSSISLGEGVLFALTASSRYDALRATSEGRWPRALHVLGGFDKGKLDVGQITIDSDVSRWSGPYNVSDLHAAGKRALMLGWREGVIIDATDVLHPSIYKRVPLIAVAQGLDIHDQDALLSAGDLGVQVIELD
mgnify:FL=1